MSDPGPRKGWLGLAAVGAMGMSAVAAGDDGKYVFTREPARYALVMGNVAYDHQEALPSAAEDIL
jgi:hypothetical protein